MADPYGPYIPDPNDGYINNIRYVGEGIERINSHEDFNQVVACIQRFFADTLLPTFFSKKLLKSRSSHPILKKKLLLRKVHMSPSTC
ncbi:hypothetical protein C343_05580 [Cryptococcus neoformans C23]|uniref:Uncharacterized protein n=2 Tax=Cryptococcus neoformans TaxID=5207 RepID=A0A854Q6V9_CRYNE|nr:hypothetical protein CNAG_07850 [Cryptococcus neoformans var. grubii H99]AUB27462.1 hypothetical protein CKF44_07850 [Cryptococcus neoformans var. grubii]OWZ28412.1 hypothetical protein C347_05618 [Cryptococcus neoformans var. grubii AD2-60a]OWZ33752.1 hypothetical protein C353_05475 [Cryptococcus neoformans var. grubii AD1-83a]OWZ40359.1 hypothetical protein C343_05580 [Cryptococcus neoformans var. grubii C23]OWZ51260.1 hypothetical protein C368_05733 [Cryptococcus neoformans var. grubii 1|eukprot:XP_012052316.1 hypothetical protein CNAG_07850 [Cryptococcus neoformans var. grubii H99]